MYLSGVPRKEMLEQPRPDLGLMLDAVRKGIRHEFMTALWWAVDNGCFTMGPEFDPAAWLAWLATLRPYLERCLFAVAPDVVGDAVGTLVRATPFLPRLRDLGFRVAFVTQDGCRSDLVPWDDIDCLFVGGSNAWKLSERSYALCTEARERGKWTHMGRVNSLRRLRACAAHRIDSVDGTHLKYEPRVGVRQVNAWLDKVNGQGVLEAAG